MLRYLPLLLLLMLMATACSSSDWCGNGDWSQQHLREHLLSELELNHLTLEQLSRGSFTGVGIDAQGTQWNISVNEAADGAALEWNAESDAGVKSGAMDHR